MAQQQTFDFARDTHEVVELTAPSDWASYLINNDASGISTLDKKRADEWVARVGLGAPVSCEDAGYGRHDAWVECPFFADRQTYSFLKKVTS